MRRPTKQERIKALARKVNWVLFAMLAALLVMIAVALFGCAVEERGLTVTPHPTYGFKIVIVPAGTWIDGFKTTEPGLYMTGDIAASLMIQLEELKRQLRETVAYMELAGAATGD
jgi:hypothetical protein